MYDGKNKKLGGSKMSKKQIIVNNKKYKVRYIYEKEDGSLWYVCDTDELQGEYGDEYPAK